MIKLDETYLKIDSKYIVGCSGGADSMALLDLMVRANYQVIVCHVNYHMRETCFRDQSIVERYCEKHQLVFYNFDSYYNHQENFENFARIERYRFFSEISAIHSCEAVVVGHQYDDVIETYLMQKERGNRPLFYGLSPVGENFGLKVIRPLLQWTKAQLEDYCSINRIETGFDESNDTDQFKRNRLRKILMNWSEQDKKEVFNQMIKANDGLSQTNKEVEIYAKKLHFPFLVEKFKSIPQSHQNLVIRYLLSQSGVRTQKISKRYIDEICDGFNHKNKVYALDKDYELIISYGKVYLERVTEYDYSYKFDRIELFKCKYFEFSENGSGLEALTLSEEDFPITVRNGKPQDWIEMRFGKKQLNRFWIDRKIPLQMRRRWLVVENKMKRIVFIEGLGCDIHHFSNKPSLFVIKYCSLEDEYYASAC